MDIDEKFFEYLIQKGFNKRWFFLASVQNLLLFVVSGFSNEMVASMVGLDKEYVSMAAENFLGFSGWEENLTYSPWYKYKNNHLTKEKDSDIIVICERYKEYRKELDDYYDKE
jgi:hypothetical protein